MLAQVGAVLLADSVREGVVVVGISQSGETADTLAVIREMKLRKIPTLAITNVRGAGYKVAAP